MYSWEMNSNEYKYESIQHGYEVEYLDDEVDETEVSLDAILESEEDELELEEVF